MKQHPNVSSIVKLRFTPEQIEEQRQFKNTLENNTANIVFEGTFTEGIEFLKDTGEFVDTFNHA